MEVVKKNTMDQGTDGMDSVMNGDDFEKFGKQAATGFEHLAQRELWTLSMSINLVRRTLNNSNFLRLDDPEYHELKWNLSNSLQVIGMELRHLYRLSSRQRTKKLRSSHLTGE